MSERRASLCECGNEARDRLLAMGVDATVTNVPPLIPSPYESLNMRCSHGVLWHTQPTSEQIAKWAEAGIR